MEASLTSSSALIQGGFRNVVGVSRISSNHFLLGVSDGRVLNVLIGINDNVHIIQDFDASPESHHSLRSLRFIPSLNAALVLCEEGSLWLHLRDRGSETFFPGFQLAGGVDSVDVVGSVGGETLVCVSQREDSVVGILCVRRTSCEFIGTIPFPEMVSHAECIQWATPSLLCVSKGATGVLMGLDGAAVHTLHDHMGLSMLGDSFSANERTEQCEYMDQFCAWGGCCAKDGHFFPFQIAVYSVCRGSLQKLIHFPLLSDRIPTFVTWRGPWIVVGSADGLELYEYESGRFAQSILDDTDVRTCDLCSQVATAGAPSASRSLFAQNTTSIIITASGDMHLVTWNSVLDVVRQLLLHASFEADRIELLQRYGHSVGCVQLAPSSFLVGTQVNSRSYLFSAYGALLARCVHVDWEISPVPHAVSNCERCATCAKDFGSVKQRPARNCAGCKAVICSACSTQLDPTEWCSQFPSHRPRKPVWVCPRCDGACDENLFMLLANRRYNQIIRFVTRFSARCHQFDVEDVISKCVSQSFREERYEWCAKLVCRYVVAQELMNAWMMKFSHVGMLSVLMDRLVEAQPECDMTLALVALVGMDPQKLFHVLRRRRGLHFHSRDVFLRIMQRLRSEQDDAVAGVESCRGPMMVAPDSAGVMQTRADAYPWYASRDVHFLILAMIRLAPTVFDEGATSTPCSASSSQISSCRSGMLDEAGEKCTLGLQICWLYLEHYLQWSRPGEYFPDTRRRSASVFENRPPCRQRAPQFQEIMDFWELFTKGGYYGAAPTSSDGQHLEELLSLVRAHKNALQPRSPCASSRSSRNANDPSRSDSCSIRHQLRGAPLLRVLLEHFRSDVCRLLFSSFDQSRRTLIVDDMVELLSSYPVSLLEFLDTLMRFSPGLVQPYASQLADLYLSHAPNRLLMFVKNKAVEGLDWLRLAAEVEARRMFPELVYIIGRTGNDREAVRIALRCLRNVSLAIQYVVDAADPQLWEETIHHVIQSEELIGQFLEVAGDRYDPASFLRRIPNDNRLRIKDVGPHLGNLVVDRKATKGIGEAFLGAIESESLDAIKKYRKQTQRATRIATFPRCFLCRQVVVDHEMFVGKRGSAHRTCFTKSFKRCFTPSPSTWTGDHLPITVSTQQDAARFELYRRRQPLMKDIAVLFPMCIMERISEWLGPFSWLCCEGVSTKWQHVFQRMKARIRMTEGELENPFVQFAVLTSLATSSHHSRSLRPPITVHTIGLQNFGEYTFCDEDA